MGNRSWTSEEIEILSDYWGTLSIPAIGKKLGRSVNAVKVKAFKEGLGSFIESGDYITMNQLFVHIRSKSKGGSTYTVQQWIEKGLPIKKKKIINDSFKVINIDDFWKWAKKHRTLIDFSALEENVFGQEPAWVKDQRQADKENAKYKKTIWTELEDKQLENLVNQYAYGYKEISEKLRRTEGAIKRRLCDLGIKARPVKKSNHNPWKEHEVEKLIELYQKGYQPEIIREHIDRSAQSIRGKIERLIKEGNLKPRSEFRKTC